MVTNTTVTIADGGLSLATTGVTIGSNGNIQLDDGRLTSAFVRVDSGGLLSGTGTVVGNLIVGGPTGSQQATLSPGLSVGRVKVEGNYQQGSTGILVIEVDGTNTGQFDTIDVAGSATLGGTLRVDVSDIPTPTSGASIRFLSAGSLTAGTQFENVETIGGDGVYFAPKYSGTSASLESFPVGDMNRNFVLDAADIAEFALALRNPLHYRARRGLFGSQSGNMDGMNGLDFSDIDDFTRALEMAGVPNAASAVHSALLGIPEPHTLVLAVLGVVVYSGRNLRLRNSTKTISRPGNTPQQFDCCQLT
jgi:hypothetical protein